MQITRIYPHGPPACLQCVNSSEPSQVGGWIGVPTVEACTFYYGSIGCTPIIDKYSNAFWMLLYVLWIVTFVAIVIWGIVRTPSTFVTSSQTPQETTMKQPDVENPPKITLPEHDDDDIEEDNLDLSVSYFRTSNIEHLFITLAVLNFSLLFVYFLVLCVDFYAECEYNGTPDNMCYFGTFRLFGNYQRNSEAFFFVWLTMSAYSLIMSVWWREMHDFVRKPSIPREADMVRIVARDKLEVLTSDEMPSFVMRLKRWCVNKWRVVMKRCCCYRAIKRPTGTVSYSKVFTNELGEQFFLHKCARYSVPDTDGSDQPRRVQCTLPSHECTIERILAFQTVPLSPTARQARLARMGTNEIHISMPTALYSIAEEFLSPFYTYQIMIYLIWIWWTYWFVGIVLLTVVVTSGLWTVYLRRKNLRAVHELAIHSSMVDVMDDVGGGWETIPARDLVPGDVVRISTGAVPADLALIKGGCAADEADLTGESMPQAKTSLAQAGFDPIIPFDMRAHQFKPHTLYAGTKILETSSDDAVGVVLATGIDATRGVLLSHVLFPVVTMFRFDEEFVVAVSLLLMYALLIAFTSTLLQAHNGATSTTWVTILAYCVFSVSQVVSPMLKIALVAGRVAASKRLQSHGITVLDPHRIDIAGKVRVFCFDKTGTLTQDGLALIDVVQVTPEYKQDMRNCMASCHSLAQFNHSLLGSAVERSMFEWTGWSFTKPDEVTSSDGEQHIQIKRRFGFDQARRTMSVIVQISSNNDGSGEEEIMGFVKGAPESIAARCNNVPDGFLTECERRSAEGCYVLALARRVIVRNDMIIHRDELEQQCELLGAIMFRNEVKPDAAMSIAELKQGHVRVVMVTGDNAPCAMYVARELAMVKPESRLIMGQIMGNHRQVVWAVPGGGTSHGELITTSELLKRPDYEELELCMTGDACDALRASNELHQILFRVRIFARTSPSQKINVVRAFVNGPQPVVTAMAGDGGNDSGALRAAHVGLSIGGAEASVVAPFCAKQGSVWSCVNLLAEGRCSLATSLASYKLLVAYGLLFSLVKQASFYYAVLIPVMGYVFIDVIALVPLTFAITLASPLKHLNPSRPTASLLGPVTVGSMVGIYIIALCSMAVNLSVMSRSTDYIRWPSQYVDTAAWWTISDNFESSVIWSTVFLLFVTCSLAFSFGAQHRASLLRNWVLVLVWVVLFGISSALLLSPVTSFTAMFHMASEPFNRKATYSPVWQAWQADHNGQVSAGMSESLRWQLWILSLIAIVCLLIWEKGVIHGPLGRSIHQHRHSQDDGGGALLPQLVVHDEGLADDEQAMAMSF